MKRKEMRDLDGQRVVDPLVWLKSELRSECTDDELSNDDIRELEELTLRLARSGAPREARLDDRALEALVEMLPSESLTEVFLDRVNQRRKYLGQVNSPAEVLRVVREKAGVSLEAAAAAFETPTDVLKRVEQGAALWYRLPPGGLVRFARLVGEPWAGILSALKHGAWQSLLRQVEGRLSLALGRYDKLQSASQARLDAVRATLAMVREENHAAMEFFRKVERLQDPGS